MADAAPRGSMGRPPRVRGRLHRSGQAPAVARTTPACAGTTGSGTAAGTRRTDDPRVRGDDSSTRSAVGGRPGRPPRARGRLGVRSRWRRPYRTTPACAGTTTGAWPTRSSSGDDPRVRGDDGGWRRLGVCWRGRPPRARGRPFHARHDPAPFGTTPACAGTTFRVDKQQWSPEDDPRVRGDDYFIGAPLRRVGWTTPACAGTTGGRWWLGVGSWDDPRVRGDDSTAGTDTAAAWGRPPRARGRRPLRHQHRPHPRTTPACAGTTSGRWTPVASPRDDPRVRGDDFMGRSPFRAGGGRPPRARGRRGCGCGDGAVSYTPPRAHGTSLHRVCRLLPDRDDPRVRGDDHAEQAASLQTYGRPPRARGRPGAHAVVAGGGGTTPACAGTTTRGGGPADHSADDPRVRGDDPATTPTVQPDAGRPPRARGRPTTATPKPSPPGDDPRVRGDDITANPAPSPVRGRPPRARGRRPAHRRRENGGGTTPACAGTTKFRSIRSATLGDDPRVRGDDIRCDAGNVLPMGRPPRARGRRRTRATGRP